MAFSYTHGTRFETLHSEQGSTNFYNLKNKADGARRYGYFGYIKRATNPLGEVAYRAVYQTTLNDQPYQSLKNSPFVATEDEARALLARTIAGALKRYAKLANSPSINKIERREG